MRKQATLFLTLSLILALGACGSSSPSSTTSGPIPGTTSAIDSSRGGGAKHQDSSHRDSGGGSQQFETKGGDNSIQEFGDEAAAADFAAAAEALHGYLDARAARAWGAACGYLAAPVRTELIRTFRAINPQDEEASKCPAVLAAFSALPPSVLREDAVAAVAAFRAEGDFGYVLFHGARDTDYFAPMEKERGRWWVAAQAPSAFP